MPDHTNQCSAGRHVGEPQDPGRKFASAADPFWHQFRTCGACGSTVALDAFVPLATKAA